MSNTAPTAEIDPKLLEILVCPQTRGPLVYDREKGELLSKKALLAYPIRDGVPIMLPEEARALSDGEAARL
ncbi:MAG: Trm112 family protein [Pseudomonadota bacterium]|nr:Trm112 family protein [Pseudomonadota bacterium]